MKSSEALEIVAILNAGFPNYSMEARSSEVWARLMTELEDAEAATLCALGFVRTGERFPTFADFRRGYLSQRKRMAESQGRSSLAALESGPKLEAPKWVRMRLELRGAGDMRAFPEQKQAYLEIGMVWPPIEGIVSAEELAAWRPGMHPQIPGAGDLVRSIG